LNKLYYYSKATLDYRLDRIIDNADKVLMRRSNHIPMPIARFIGNMSFYIRHLPRIDVYQLKGEQWSILFLGRKTEIPEFSQLFFSQNTINVSHLGRVPVWNIPRKLSSWFDGGIDLVIYETACLDRFNPQTPIWFTTPTWVNQKLILPEDINNLIAGKRFATTRNRINKAKRNGFSYRFSQSVADFDYFYNNMYLPYVKTRHGDLAVLAQYQDQRTRWFEQGGLLLVTYRNEPVAGVLCYIAGDTCFDIERGVLQADPKFFKMGIDTLITWYGLNWAYQQGAKFFNMGGSHARLNCGTFNSKRRWGASVIQRQRIYANWHFVAQNLTPYQQDFINNIGFIMEIGKQFYTVVINDEHELKAKLSQSSALGISGVAFIQPEMGLQIYHPTPN